MDNPAKNSPVDLPGSYPCYLFPLPTDNEEMGFITLLLQHQTWFIGCGPFDLLLDLFRRDQLTAWDDSGNLEFQRAPQYRHVPISEDDQFHGPPTGTETVNMGAPVLIASPHIPLTFKCLCCHPKFLMKLDGKLIHCISWKHLLFKDNLYILFVYL